MSALVNLIWLLLVLSVQGDENEMWNQNSADVEVDNNINGSETLEMVENSANLSSVSEALIVHPSSVLNLTELLVNVTNPNEASLNGTQSSSNEIDCVSRNLTSNEIPGVVIVNTTKLLEYLTPVPTIISLPAEDESGSSGGSNESTTPVLNNVTNQASKVCTLVLFYYNWCPFSMKAAPPFNAVGRLFPQLNVIAFDAYSHNSVNMRYGMVGIPTILLFQNGKAIAKYNETSPTLEGFVSFIHRVTGFSPVLSKDKDGGGDGDGHHDQLNLTEEDYLGPLKSQPESGRVDHVLLLSVVFNLIAFVYLFSKSSLFQKLAESLRNNWREAEAEAEHQHLD